MTSQKPSENLKRNVTAAAVIILLMKMTALLRDGSVSLTSSALVSVGAFLFMISDSILSFKIFCRKKGRGVMETYTAAQLLIVCGLLFV